SCSTGIPLLARPTETEYSAAGRNRDTPRSRWWEVVVGRVCELEQRQGGPHIPKQAPQGWVRRLPTCPTRSCRGLEEREASGYNPYIRRVFRAEARKHRSRIGKQDN